MEPAARAPEPEDAPPARGGPRPRLYVERRAVRRDTPDPVAATRPSPLRWWPAIGLGAALLVGVLFAVGAPYAALAATAGIVLVQSGALLRLHRQAGGLAQLARGDDLTGLGNARALWADLDALLAAGSVALVVADLDHFKQINDHHGHGTGDAVLRAVGGIVVGVAGPDARCYRYGGEELVVVLPGTDETDAAQIAERLRARVGVGVTGLPRVTTSAGVSVAAAGTPAWAAFDRADDALRHAKLAGRDQVVRASTLAEGQASEDAAAGAARRAALAIATAALEARDVETADHSDDVVLLCEAIADRLGIVGLEREHLMAAARLHDIGKVAIPHEILAKPGPLDEGEWEVMRRHTITGEQILRAVPEMAPIAPLVRSAHERYDGKGYPDGLSGEEIPLGSRVILCADAFHAIRSDRPYRSSRSPEVAIEELTANAGGQFDPVVAATLIDVVRDANRPGRLGGRRITGSPRLMALLATAAISGSAVAAVPSLRHVVDRMLPSSPRTAQAPAAPRAADAQTTCAELALRGVRCGAAGAFAPVAFRAPEISTSASVTRPDRSTGGKVQTDGATRESVLVREIATSTGAAVPPGLELVDALAPTAPSTPADAAAPAPETSEQATDRTPPASAGEPAGPVAADTAKPERSPDPGTPQGNPGSGSNGNPDPGTPQGNPGSGSNGNPDPGTPQGNTGDSGNGHTKPDPGPPADSPSPGPPPHAGNGNSKPDPGPPASPGPPPHAGGGNGGGNGNPGTPGGGNPNKPPGAGRPAGR